MQAIGFNEHYGLQTAVFEGRKTMTRRTEKGFENLEEGNFCFQKGRNQVVLYGEKGTPIEIIKLRYKVGEIVAIRQSYSEVYDELFGDVAHINNDRALELHMSYILMEAQKDTIKGWTNKMFIRPDLMPRHIRITDVDLQRLQSISDEDCLKEGVAKLQQEAPCDGFFIRDESHYSNLCYNTPREAFSALIDKVSGKGTWERNQFMPAYSFELID